MSDKEIIIKTLERVERRIRANRLFKELGLDATLFLAFPLACKVWDLFYPFKSSTITILAGTWILLFAAYVVWRSLRKTTENHAAVSIDKAADLKDEIKTAIWFIHNPRPSDWVDAQIHRAADRTRTIDIDRFFPRYMPKTAYLAAAFFLFFIALNFVPLPWNHNWLMLQAAPAFTLTPQEAEMLKQTQALLQKANELKKSEVAQKLEDVAQDLKEGKMDAAQVLEKLNALQNQLSEGNLDAASMREGLQEMAKSLAQSDKLDATAEAINNQDLNKAADELRKAAEKLGSTDPQSRSKMQKSLQQASENPRAGLEELAQRLKEAAEDLKNEDQKDAQVALDEAGQELDQIEEKLQNQDLKNLAAEQLQNLQQSLRQSQQAGKQQARAKSGQDQKVQNRQKSGEGDQGDSPQAGSETEGDPSAEPAQQSAQAGGNNNGNGLMPSGKGGGDAQREGPPTTLDVQLQKEQIEGMHDQDQGLKEDLDEVSKQERSKLDYRNVKSELSPAQKDLLNQDRIPWEYRSLIKDYFQAIRPPSAK
jgi:hypothetical protein